MARAEEISRSAKETAEAVGPSIPGGDKPGLIEIGKSAKEAAEAAAKTSEETVARAEGIKQVG